MINSTDSLKNIYSEIISKLQGRNLNCSSTDRVNLFNFEDKKILITGGAGSIGSAIAERAANLRPLEIALVDINESGLADLMLDLKELNKCDIRIYLTDVSDEKSIEKIFLDFKPDYVYHAAAYKHVPVLELFPEQALRVNIVGTYNVAKFAGRLRAEKFILISSDKVVNPSSVLGLSKSVAENIIKKIYKNYATKYITIRFGNVIGSRGSVSEIFRKQIQRGRPVTLTHHEMKRFFITMDEAVDQTLHISDIGKDGNLYVLDMKEPIYIKDLIVEFINRFANPKVPRITTVITGIRPGEKLDEMLMTREELNLSVREDGYFRINADSTFEESFEHIEYFKNFDNESYNSIYDELLAATDFNFRG